MGRREMGENKFLATLQFFPRQFGRRNQNVTFFNFTLIYSWNCVTLLDILYLSRFASKASVRVLDAWCLFLTVKMVVYVVQCNRKRYLYRTTRKYNVSLAHIYLT